ncbi:MAG: isoleucine--tRNA ligase [Egibacteraceae bacterium]
MTSQHQPYPDVDAQPSFPEIERRSLEVWEREGTFRASVEQREGDSNEFVFYDGPPFANGLPHYGHLLTGFVKDTVPRYKTMRGRRVERRFGWDCHGLPAEMETEKQLGLSSRKEIMAYGVDRFNEVCRSSVLKYTGEWRDYVTRQARWVDFENDYKTMDQSYMESVLWAVKTLWERGLIYEGLRVLPYCWECETPLSNFETRLDDAYREREDPAITVAFRLHVEPGEPDTRIVAWTTTPWTLPSNLALAVNPNEDYAVLERERGRYVVAAASADRLSEELGRPARHSTIRGADLAGRTYEPLFPFFAGTENAFRILLWDSVDPGDGTGVVHLAPGFGEEDQSVCEAHGIPVVCPVDDQGRFTSDVPDFAGLQVFAANQPIIRALKDRDLLLKEEAYRHSYPHCWRTDTPLIYRAVSSWFVRVTAIKDRLLELNKSINWVPSHVRDGAFGKWLENARDWAISRSRFWGSPIPVWKSDNLAYPRIDVYGSLDELERDFGIRPEDLHRPAIDSLTRPNPDDPTGRSTMRRVPEVLDCWFESGSMPFAQVHYPFERREWFEEHFPADFIVEYIGQTRGWFYTLHVLATALFDQPPFKNCLVHGVALGEDGRKMSKRLRNYPDPEQVFVNQGADAMRWFLLSSPILHGQNLVVHIDGIDDVVRQVLKPIWNSWHFFSLYANADGVEATWRTDATNPLDRYILAKARRLVAEVTERMDSYDLYRACEAIPGFLDALNNWYIRRSRDRFWKTDRDQDKIDAYDTLFTVLDVLCRVAAPLLPLLTEAIYRGLHAGRSVHLADWPDSDELPDDLGLVSAVDHVREVCSAALAVRTQNNLRVRLPLRSLTVVSPDTRHLELFTSLIAEELNVKTVRFSSDVEQFGQFVLQVKPSVVGPRLGQATQHILAEARRGAWSLQDGGTVAIAGSELRPEEFELRFVPRDERASRTLPGGQELVVLDLEVTPDLLAEGLARDVVRVVQTARKQAGLKVDDRIHLTLDVPGDVAKAVERYRRYVMEQTLARDLVLAVPVANSYRFQLPDGQEVQIGLHVVESTQTVPAD